MPNLTCENCGRELTEDDLMTVGDEDGLCPCGKSQYKVGKTKPTYDIDPIMQQALEPWIRGM